MSMEVTLLRYELIMAAQVGWRRQFQALMEDKKDCHGFNRDPWETHVEGACGEMALAKALGIYWDGSVGTWKADDLPGIQVRTRSKHEWDLLIRPGDDVAARWVLVTGKISPAGKYLVHGWIYGHEARQDEFKQTYGGRSPAWFVPQSRLRPIETLQTEATDGR